MQQTNTPQKSSLPSLLDILRDRPLYLESDVGVIEASEITGTPVASLETMRVRGGGPAFVKRGKRVFYKRRTLLEWMNATREQTSTSDIPLEVA